MAALLVAVGWYFDIEIDVEDEEEDKDKNTTPQLHTTKELTEEEKGEEQDESQEVEIPETMPEDAIFIPLGFTRQLPLTFYKGSDPEWKSFVEFRNDGGRGIAVRKELTLHISSHFSGIPPMQKALGAPMRVKRFWLDVLIPEGPPPEYERSGLEIGDDYIAWTTRPVSAYQNARFQSAIFPLPIAKSFWASFNTAFSLQYAKIKRYLNLDNNTDMPHSFPSSMTKLDELQEDPDDPSPQTPSTRMNKLSDPKSTDNSADAKIDTQQKSASPPPSSSDSSSRIHPLLPSLPSLGDENNPSTNAFKRTLARNWRGAYPEDFGQRGTLVVTGMVQIDGPKGSCVVDVVAAYHPVEARYTSISCGIRNYRPRVQRPRGGP
ncbi:hypothetical protein ACLMJK_006940 [Lecanora helva]